MAIFALSICQRSTLSRSEPKRSIRATQVLNLEGIISGKAFTAKNIVVPKTKSTNPTFVRYFIGYLPTNNTIQHIVNIIAAVDKFAGKTKPTIAATGNHTNNKVCLKVCCLSSDHQRYHAK